MFIQKALNTSVVWNRYVFCSSFTSGVTELRHEYCTVVTDADITHHATITIVNKALRQIFLLWQSIHHDEPLFCSRNVDLVLDIVPDGVGNDVCEYYLAYHPTRVIFWPEEVNPSEGLLFNMKGVHSEAHIGYAIAAQYWHHRGLYPSISCPGQAVLDELKDMILHGLGDHLISASSTTSYGPDELKTMLDIVTSGVSDLQNAPGLCRILCILMKHFAEEKFANLHGEEAVRLNRGVSIFDSTPRKESRRFCVISILLFNAPRRHLSAIETISVDGIISRRAWNQFAAAVQKTCSDLTVYCTVLIAMVIGVSAIQSVDAAPNTSGIKMLLYLSVVACFGSITFAFLLQRKHEDILQVSFSEAVRRMILSPLPPDKHVLSVK
ncbi:hypothetical protein ARMSODRAFT_1024834 [Armillaria solidipes]|uniref:Uncharacterized protein n=1 Tax=Armillaria solidipes TaxID=1076256 RepID=A0A2H3BCV0_9AGAR|nr:hypothetical protein ARMSODRAFT_1024834 [Armillaria solidipes]